MSLRAHVCHILSLVTRRKHVKPFRIQALLELKRNVGNEQPLNALLQVYKNYYPDVIVGDVGSFKAGVFSHPNPEWMQRLLSIQETDAASNPNLQHKASFRTVRQVREQSKRRKIRQIDLPEAHTFQAVESSVTLEEVQSADDFVEKLYEFELPNQMVAVLEDSLLQKLLTLRPNDSSQDRINNWLAACLEDELRLSKNPTPGASSRTGALLTKIFRYTRSERKLLPSVADFLQDYLRSWDGVANIDSLLGLVCYIPCQGFEVLHVEYLGRIEEVLLESKNEKSGAKLLEFYSELLRRWAVIFNCQFSKSGDLEAESKYLQKIVNHVGDICLRLVQEYGCLSGIADAILSFYECASSVPWEKASFRIVLPPRPLVYHFIFVGDPMLISRICGILIEYKQPITLWEKHSSQTEGDKNEILHFNGYCMDICSLLWQNRAFVRGEHKFIDPADSACNIHRHIVAKLKNDAAERSAGKSIDSPKQRDRYLFKMYSLSTSGALAQLAKEKIPANARSVRPVTVESLSREFTEYRKELLDDLYEKGLIGLQQLIYGSMVSFNKGQPRNSPQNAAAVSLLGGKQGLRRKH